MNNGMTSNDIVLQQSNARPSLNDNLPLHVWDVTLPAATLRNVLPFLVQTALSHDTQLRNFEVRTRKRNDDSVVPLTCITY